MTVTQVQIVKEWIDEMRTEGVYPQELIDTVVLVTTLLVQTTTPTPLERQLEREVLRLTGQE
jgi:hypothetical protein